MNEAQVEQFYLRDVPNPTGMGTTMYVDAPNNQPMENEEDVASRGMANAQQYMATNGPVFPIQLKRALNQAKVMTQAQLEEQKMNESQGLPSNLDEASRVKTLETTVSGLNTNMEAILALLRDPAQGPLVAQPRTPPVKPVEVQPVPSIVPPQPQPVLDPRPTPVSVRHVPETAVQTVQNTSPESTPDFFPHHSTSTTETEADRIERIVRERLAAIDQDDRRAEVEDLEEQLQESKRLADANQVPPGDPTDPVEQPSPDQPIVDVVEELEPDISQTEAVRLKRLEALVSQTTQWIKVKNPLKFFKRFIGTTCNKNLSFNTWPATTQAAFTKRFEATVRDPAFVSTICGRIMNMDNGKLVAPHVAGAFTTVLAGFLSFAMTEV